MTDQVLLHQVQSNLASLTEVNTVCLAYSGGVDSQVLLHILTRLKQSGDLSCSLVVCHVHHGLSANADDWAEFAEQICTKLSVELVVKRVDLDISSSRNIEQKARTARYQALTEVARAKGEGTVILTGHHLDDQTETLMLALKRGSGLKGLAAMSTQSSLAGYQTEFNQQDLKGSSNGSVNHSSRDNELSLIRPLLDCRREQIEQYAKLHQLEWIEDESNSDDSFDRNFLRNQVLPLIEQRWPQFNQAVSRSASHCRSGQALLDEIAQQDLDSLKIAEGVLSVTLLKELSEHRFNNVIRYFFASCHLLMPSTEQLNQLRQQLNAADDKVPALKLGDYWLRRYQQKLYLTPSFQDLSEQLINLDLSAVEQGGELEVELPDQLGHLSLTLATTEQLISEEPDNNTKEPKKTFYFQLNDHDQVLDKEQLAIRFSHDNPKCTPDYRQHSRPLKKVLQELGLPPWQRKRLPLLYYRDQFIGIAGLFICKPYLPDTGKETKTQVYCVTINY
ncbi:tRNA lysidine(34) synthetase TilS [Endozoicomonas sp. G2_1]|uniref:tRNA lysidine(34) synthetase TilS n=1 Tax=Endozoicomonas sp. G2_1 TaxID=2821091 RepID=UPI001ADD35E4|nr:tRNA lysidine(34) synthetase TilS [Endozoicomonas sp. G2_1]MBO9492160.1 tRNA lysidine(34) synthetase TilS [Endozoicomonas sp. G2_1]